MMAATANYQILWANYQFAMHRSRVSLEASGNQLMLEIANLNHAVSLSVDTALSVQQLPGLSWLTSLDEICGRAGICDRRLIDGGTLNTPLLQIDPTAQDITRVDTPWSMFVEQEPVAVWAVTQPRLMVKNPWHNATP